MRVLIRCDASSAIGFGHITRCLTLAASLRDRHGATVVFLTRGGAGATRAQSAGHAVRLLPADEDYGTAVRDAVAESRADVFIGDVRDGLPRQAVASMRGVLRVAVDEPSDYRLACDLAFYPPIPAIEAFDWAGFSGRRYLGWEYVILRETFARKRAADRVEDVLITMGGADPNHQTERILNLLRDMPLKVTAVIGPGFGDTRDFQAIPVAAGGRRSLVLDPQDMAGLMATARLAVAAFGVTAFELAAMNTPAVYLCHNPHDMAAADVLAAKGFAVNAGVYDQVEDEALGAALTGLLEDEARRTAMARACDVMDGHGADRIADIIAAEVRPGVV